MTSGDDYSIWLQNKLDVLTGRLEDHAKFAAQIEHLHDDIKTIRDDVKSLLMWRAYTLGAAAAVSAGVAILLKNI